MDPDELMTTFLNGALESLRNRALQYHSTGASPEERFARMTEIKNDLLKVGKPETFSIAPQDYNSCPEGICKGGVCMGASVAVTDADLITLGKKLKAL